MRLAFISDMHGNAVAFEKVIDDLNKHAPDAVICLGDVTIRGPQPKECVALLQSLDPLFTLRGNFDHRFTRLDAEHLVPENARAGIMIRAFKYACEYLSEEEMAWLAHLPTEKEITLAGMAFEFYHAAPGSLTKQTWPWASDEELGSLFQYDDTKIVVFGHMHHAFVRTMGGKMVINTGSIGLSFDGDNRASYALVDIHGQDAAVQIRRVSYDIEKAIQVAHDRNMPDCWAFEYALRQANYPYHLEPPVVKGSLNSS